MNDGAGNYFVHDIPRHTNSDDIPSGPEGKSIHHFRIGPGDDSANFVRTIPLTDLKIQTPGLPTPEVVQRPTIMCFYLAETVQSWWQDTFGAEWKDRNPSSFDLHVSHREGLT